MTLERRSIEYDDRTTFNPTFNVIFLTLSSFFRLRVWFLKTVFSRINGSFYFSYVRNIPSLPLLFCNAVKCNRTYSPCPILIITKSSEKYVRTGGGGRSTNSYMGGRGAQIFGNFCVRTKWMVPRVKISTIKVA